MKFIEINCCFNYALCNRIKQSFIIKFVSYTGSQVTSPSVEKNFCCFLFFLAFSYDNKREVTALSGNTTILFNFGLPEKDSCLSMVSNTNTNTNNNNNFFLWRGKNA